MIIGLLSALSHPIGFIGGLDHVPIAVRDLDESVRLFQKLGFSLKKGRPHDNSITNYHAKFSDGTELELITATDALDPVSAGYVSFLKEGEGPAYLCLYEPDMPTHLNKPDYIFFGRRNYVESDPPEIYHHRNGALRLSAVWLSGRDRDESALFSQLGYLMSRSDTALGESVNYSRGDSTVRLVASSELVRIVGVTVRVKTLELVRSVLGESGIVWRDSGGSLFVESVVGDSFVEFQE